MSIHLLPHWTVNNVKTYSQINAWKMAVAADTTPEFYFYDAQYETVDWTKEPNETWDELLLERCVTLRQKYKTLSLFYSAGRDSHHVLNCFGKNRIPLDELVLLDLYNNPIRKKELYTYILPMANQFVKMFPNTKIKIIEVRKQEFDQYFKDNWLEHNASSLVHGFFQPSNFSFYVKKIMRADEPNHGVILGVDKPRLLLKDNKIYSAILDKVMETFISDIPNVEYFYYAPDMPKLHLKQSWMVLNHLESNYKNKINTELLTELCDNAHGIKYDEFCLACGRGPAFDITLAIQNGKSKYKLLGKEPVFQKILNDALEEKWQSSYNYLDAMNYLQKNYAKIFNKNDAMLGTVGVYAKKFFMKELS